MSNAPGRWLGWGGENTAHHIMGKDHAGLFGLIIIIVVVVVVTVAVVAVFKLVDDIPRESPHIL